MPNPLLIERVRYLPCNTKIVMKKGMHGWRLTISGGPIDYQVKNSSQILFGHKLRFAVLDESIPAIKELLKDL